ncbi:Ig-like domain repeat protein [Microbacterium paulum]
MQKRPALIAFLVSALLAMSASPAMAAPLPAASTDSGAAGAAALTVQLAVPDGYSAPADLPLDFTTVTAYLTSSGSSGGGKESGLGDIGGGSSRATADGAGILRFEGLAPGAYDLWIESPARSDLRGGGWNEDGLRTDRTTPITVATGATSVTATFTRGGLLRGTVVDQNGTPVAGATVSPGGSATDAAGGFAVGLAPGTSRIYVTAPDGSGLIGGVWVADDLPLADVGGGPSSGTDVVTGDDLAVTPRTIVARLKVGATISGTVRDDAGVPVADAEIWTDGAQTTTASDGTYRLTGVAGGSHTVSVTPKDLLLTSGYVRPDGTVGSDWSAALRVDVVAGATVNGVDARLQPAGAVAGTVSGLPSSVRVSVYATPLQGGNGSSGSGTTDTFRIGHLTAGTWHLEFSTYDTTGDVGGPGYLIDGVDVVVTAGVESTVAVAAYAGGSITATVRSATGELVESGDVRAVRTDGPGGMTRFGQLGAGGSLRVGGLVTGTYALEVISPEGVLRREGVVVTVGQESALGDVQLSAATVIVVHVQDAAGAPLPGVSVWISSSGGSGTSATTNAAGDARLVLTAGGTYDYAVYAGGYASVSETVTVATGATVSTTAVLSRMTSVQVTVAHDGRPLAARSVIAQVGDGPLQWWTTDAAGVFALQTADTGPLVVRLPLSDGTYTYGTWSGSAASSPVTVDSTTAAVQVELDDTYAIDVSLRDYGDEPAPGRSFSLVLTATGESVWMSAGPDGTARVTGVAAGEYTLKSWSDDGDPLSAQVTLSASQPTAAVVLAPPAGIDVVRITGVVRDDSGAPAPGERVRLVTSPADGGSESSREVVAGDDGAFGGWVRRGDRYTIIGAVGEDSMFAPAAVSGDVPAEGAVARDIELAPGRSVSFAVRGGTAADPSGVSESVPLADVSAQAYLAVDGTSAQVYRVVQTDAAGTATLRGLPLSGDVSGWISGTSYYAGQSVEFAAGATYTLELRGEATIRVALADGATGQATITLDGAVYYGFDLPLEQTWSGLAGGTHTLTARAEGWVPRTVTFDVIPGETVSVPEIVLGREATVEGVVTVSGIPLAGASVSATDATGADVSVVTDRNGAYALVGLAPGEVTVHAAWGSDELATATVTARAGTAVPLDLAGDPSVVGSLVRVDVSGTAGAHQGYVELTDATRSWVSARAWLDEGVAQFTGVAVSPKMFRLYLGGDAQYLSGWLDLQGAVVDASEAGRTTVGPGTFVAFTAAAQRPVTLSGVVRNAAGTPLPGIFVTAGDANVATDASGAYTIDVRPSTRALAISDGYGPYLPTSVPLSGLSEGTSRTVDVALVERGAVDVTVTDIDGAPVADAVVRLEPQEGSGWTMTSGTDADGIAHFTSLDDVDYRIWVEGTGPHDIGAYVLDASGEPRTVRPAPGTKLALGQVLQRYGTVRVDLGFDDEPRAGEVVTVDVLDGDGTVVASSGGLDAAATTVTLDGIRPGTYTVRVHSDAYRDAFVSPGAQTSDPASAGSITVRGDATVIDLDARLSREWVTSSATLTAPDDVRHGEGFSVEVGLAFDGTPAESDGLGYRLTVDGDEVTTGWVSPLNPTTFSLDVPSLSVGTHTLEVVFDGGYAVRGSSARVDVVVARAVPSVTIGLDPAYGEYGAPRTVTVSAQLPDGSPLSGTATLSIAGADYDVTVEDGVGTVDLPTTLAVGVHPTRVVWAQTADTEAVDATGGDLVVVARQASVAASGPVGGDGQPITIGYGDTVVIPFTVTVPGLAPDDALGGTVQLRDGATVLDEQDASGATPLRVAAAELGAGTHQLTVAYTGDDTTRSASVGVTVEVRGQATQTMLDAPSAAVWGDTIAVGITVSGEVETPAGDVTLQIDGADAATAPLVDGHAVVSIAAPSAGTHRITAVYAGAGESLGSASAESIIDVAQADATVTLGEIADGVFGSASTASVQVGLPGREPGSGPVVAGTVRAWVDGVEVSSAALAGGSASLALPERATVGAHEVLVTFDGTDDVRAASSVIRSWTMRTGPPVVDLTLDAPRKPLVGGVASVSLGLVATGDGVTPLTYRLWWGDGSPVVTGTYAGPLDLTHDYTAAGRYFVRVEVESAGETTSYVTARNARFTAYPDVPLTAAALDAQAVIVGDTVSFDASASQPAIAIDAVSWDFGDGATGSGWRPTHVYAEPGSYTVTLTVTLGDAQASSTSLVTVAPVPPVEGVRVTVTSGGALVNGATVTHIAADGTRVQAVSAGDGTALLRGLADGIQPVYVTAGGYLPTAGEVTVQGGDGEVTIDLAAGEVAASTLEHRTLTYEEIVERGIDPAAPENQNVFLAEVHLAIVPPDAPTPTPANQTDVELVYNGGGRVVSVVYSGDGWVSDGGGSAVSGGYRYTPTIVDAGGTKAVQWMIIPVKGSWLKEFFEVRMVVQNLAAAPFAFTDGEATLHLPAGLSLAPTARPQSLTASVPDIAAGQSQTTYWTLRGDTEGEYDLSADYSGLLAPTGDPIAVTATADRPLKVWGGSAVSWSVATDPSTESLDPFRIALTLTNITPADTGVPVYNPAFEVMQGTGYLLAPHTDYAKSVPVLLPGQSVQMEFVMHSLLTGDVNVDDPRWEQSFILPTGGNVQPEHGPITLLPERTEALDIAAAWTPMPASSELGLALGWERVDGVQSYELWGRTSLDPAEPWTLVTDGVREGVPDGRVIAESSAQLFRYYTVISVFADGSTKPAHRIIEQPEKPQPWDRTGIDQIDVNDSSSLTLDGACYDVLMVGVAGSGEHDTIGAPVGVISKSFLETLRDKSGDGWADGDALRSFRSVYIPYDAAAVPVPFVNDVDPVEYVASIQDGIDKLTRFLESRVAQCGAQKEKIVLAGYSQGALVISQVLENYRLGAGSPSVIDASRIAGVYLVANPANWPGYGGTEWGTSTFAAGIAALGVPGTVTAGHHVPGALTPLTVTLCDRTDIVCASTDTVGAGAGGGVVGAGKAAYVAVVGYATHTTYAQLRIDTLKAMAQRATERVLRIPVPVDTSRDVATLEDAPFESQPIALKYLRPDVVPTWTLAPCAPTDAHLAVEPFNEDVERSFAARLTGTRPPGYSECTLTVSNGDHAFDRDVKVHVRSGWAEIAAAATPKQTVGPDYELKPPAVTITSADGTVVPGAQAVFTIVGPATFPDGSRTITVTAGADGVALAPTPVPVPGASGTVQLTAQIPGRESVDLGTQTVYGGLPDGLTAVTAAVWDAETQTAALDVLLANDTDDDATFTLSGALVGTAPAGSAAPIVTEVPAHGTATVRLHAASAQLPAGAVLAQVTAGSGPDAVEGGQWLVYRDWDATEITLSLASDAASVVYGTPVGATVTATAPAGLGDGTIELLVDDVVVGQQSAAASVVFAPAVYAAGTHVLTARFVSGDAVRAVSAPVTVQVAQATPTVALEVPADAALLGASTDVRVRVNAPGVAVGDAVAVLSGETVIAQGLVDTVNGAEGSATVAVDTVALGAGVHTLVARFGGNLNVATAVAPAATLTVWVPTTVQASVEPVAAGVTGEVRIGVTASHDLDDDPLSGDVTVSAPGWSEPLTATLVDGAAIVTLPARSVGTLPLTVSYGGAGLYAPSSSTVDAVVTAAPAQVALQLSATQAVFGDQVGAEVSVSLGTGATATGTVHVRLEGADAADPDLAAGTLDGGAASLVLPRLPAGEYRLVAVFAPATSDASAATSQAATLTIAPAEPGLQIVVEQDAVVSGADARAAVSVTAPAADGGVSVVDAAVTADVDGAPVPVVASGTAWAVTIPTAGLSAGVHTVTVRAVPASADYREVTGTATFTVTARDGDLQAWIDRPVVSVDDAPAVLHVALGAPGATVDVRWPGGGTSATLSDDGTAQVTLPALGVGRHDIVTRFVGTDTVAADSVTVAYTVTDVAGAVTATGSRTRYAVETPSVQVGFVGVPAGAAAPSGRVEVREGDVVLTDAALGLDGQASIDLTPLSVGTHTLTVVYAGDERFAASTAEVVVVVDAAPTRMDVEWPPSTSFGTAAVVRAGVSLDGDLAPGASAPAIDGVIELLVDGAVVASGSAAGAELALPADLAVGAHVLSVRYAGSAVLAPAQAGGAVQVTAVTTALTATADASVAWGQSVGVEVTLTAGGQPLDGPVTARVGAVRADAVAQGGRATLQLDTHALAAGDYELVVDYAGSATHAASTARASVRVVALESQLTVTATPSTVPDGLVDMTVAVSAPGEQPSGMVTAVSSTGPMLSGVLVGGRVVLVVPASIGDGDHRYVVTYVGSTGIGSSPGEASFTIERQTASAQVTPSQSTFALGSEQTVVIEGLEPGETVVVFLHSTPRYLGTAVADGAGVARLSFVVPAGLESGRHRIEVRRDSGVLSTFVTVQAVSPGGGSGGDSGTGGAGGTGGTGGGSTGAATAGQTGADRLSQTGGRFHSDVLVVGALFVLVGAFVLVWRRRRATR